MTRFFTKRNDISGRTILLNAEDAAHIRSLRLKPDELFVVCDGEGTDHICRLSETYDKNSPPEAEIVETRPSAGEPTVNCTVYIAYSKGERLDYAVQKSVELGAREIILYPSARCVSVPRDVPKKITRFQRIALETAKQSFRGHIPEVSSAGSFKEVIDRASLAGLPIFFYECEYRLHLKQLLEQNDTLSSVSIVTGPEGGFEPHEAEYAKTKGMNAVSLGPRILRCETAPAAALAAIMYHTGNL